MRDCVVCVECVCVGWVRVRVCCVCVCVGCVRESVCVCVCVSVCLSVCVWGIATHDLFLSSETKALFTFSVSVDSD